MTPEILNGAAAILLSLGFSYIPGLNTWYGGLKTQEKQLLMLGLLILVGAASFGMACAGWLTDFTGMVLACDKPTAILVVKSVVLAIIANQSVYLISPETQAVTAAKAER